jgi:lysozyme
MIGRSIIFALSLFVATSAFSEDFPSDPTHVTSLSQVEALEGTSLGAAGVEPRVLLPLALDLIKDFEKWRPNAYNDASNYCTIGYGHLVAKKSCSESADELSKFKRPLTETDGLALLTKDTTVARLDVQALVHTQQSDEEFGALTSFVFNIGGGNFSTSRMLKYLNNGDDGALKEFPKWIKSKGQVLEGLIIRRACEASLFKAQLSYGLDHKFHRDDCGSLGAAPGSETLIDVTIGEKP